MTRKTLIVLAIMGCSLPALAQPRVADPIPASEAAATAQPRVVTRLDNGLTLVVLPSETPGLLAYYTLVRVGSRDEVEAGHSGFAHLFEHMMFRGTESVPKEEYERRIQSFGADNNAYTTQDFTLYTVTAPTTALEQLVELEADRFQHLSYAEAEFRTETGAVLGEYNKSAADPYESMWEALSELSFTRHTYGHTTIGYLRDVRAMPGEFDYSRNFFRRFYTPDDCVLVIAGQVDPAAVRALVERHYGGWRGRRASSRIPREAEPREGRSRHIPWEGETPGRILIGYRTPGFVSGTGAAREASLRETAALQVVHGLAFGESSPLVERLVVDEQKLLELDSWARDFSIDPHLFVVSAVLKDGAITFEDVEGAVQAELASIATGHADDARVRDVVSRLRYEMMMSLETASDVAETQARFMAFGGTVETLDDYLRVLSTVTPADVARVASRYLVETRRMIVTLAHGGAQ